MNGGNQTVYEGKALTLQLEQAIYPDGSTETLEIVRHPGGAGVIAVNHHHQICLLRQYRFAVDNWLWEVPAGRIEHGEIPLETAKRELLEEAGVTANRWHPLGSLFPSPGICDERISLFIARDITMTNTAHESTEFIEIHWLPLAEAINCVSKGEVYDAKTMIALFAAHNYLEGQM